MSAIAQTPPVALLGEKAYLRKRRVPALPLWLGAILCTAGVFFLLPFTQMIASLGKKPLEVLTVDVAPPPPPPPLDLTPPEQPPENEPPPDVKPPPQQLSLSQMDVALNLGVGDAVAGAFTFEGFGVTADDTTNQMEIFDVKDLDSVPHRIGGTPPAYPPQLRKAKIGGKVTLLVVINEAGAVHVEKVVNSTLKEFEASAIACAESNRFEPPKKGGRTVRAHYILPIVFQP